MDKKSCGGRSVGVVGVGVEGVADKESCRGRSVGEAPSARNVAGCDAMSSWYDINEKRVGLAASRKATGGGSVWHKLMAPASTGRRGWMLPRAEHCLQPKAWSLAALPGGNALPVAIWLRPGGLPVGVVPCGPMLWSLMAIHLQ